MKKMLTLDEFLSTLDKVRGSSSYIYRGVDDLVVRIDNFGDGLLEAWVLDGERTEILIKSLYTKDFPRILEVVALRKRLGHLYELLL